jgi:hypothetical protein
VERQHKAAPSPSLLLLLLLLLLRYSGFETQRHSDQYVYHCASCWQA